MKSDIHQTSLNLQARLVPTGKKWMRSGHPWIYRTHLQQESLSSNPGFLWAPEGAYAYSPQSEIRLRRAEAFDGYRAPNRSPGNPIETLPEGVVASLEEKLLRLWKRKSALVQGDECFRWIFSETDGWPGLVVDVFGQDIVAQIQTAPMEAAWPEIREALTGAARKALNREPVVRELRATPARKREGLEVIPLEAAGPGDGAWYKWNGFEWWFHPGKGQKTGAYLDQRENHRRAADWAREMSYRKAWDVFSFEGGFGLHLARAGLEVECVDQSASALEVLRKNATRNDIPPERIRTTEANAFDWLKAESEKRPELDLVVLDPPSFLRSRKDKESALRGFKEINLRGFRALRDGGMLISCSCSHHIRPEDYSEMLSAAATDARRRCRVVEVRGPSPDHAPRLGFPESEYLQAWYIEVFAG